MYKIYGDDLDPELLYIGEADHGACSVALVYIHLVDGLVKRREDLGCLKSRNIEESAPDIGRREATGSEASDNAKVIGASFECSPEVGVG